VDGEALVETLILQNFDTGVGVKSLIGKLLSLPSVKPGCKQFRFEGACSDHF
jgi:hypothetical protein